jgi:hypothetical protein
MSTPPNQPPNVLGTMNILVSDYQHTDGNWFPMLTIKTAMDFVQFGVILSPDAARAIGNSLAKHADDCEKKLVVPPNLVARA